MKSLSKIRYIFRSIPSRSSSSSFMNTRNQSLRTYNFWNKYSTSRSYFIPQNNHYHRLFKFSTNTFKTYSWRYKNEDRNNNHQQASFLFLFGLTGLVGIVAYRILELVLLKKADPSGKYQRSHQRECSTLENMRESHKHFSKEDVIMKKYSRFLRAKKEVQEFHEKLDKSFQEYKKRLIVARKKFAEKQPEKFEELKDMYYVQFQNMQTKYQKVLHKYRFQRDAFFEEATNFLTDTKSEFGIKIMSNYRELIDLLLAHENSVDFSLSEIRSNEKNDRYYVNELETFWRRKNRELRDLEYLGWKFPDFRSFITKYWYVLAFTFLFIAGMGVQG